jgi:hypothetical protein
MAGNDSINIDIGDGNVISVPKWAQEITADTIVNQLKLGNKFQKDLLKNLSDLTVDVKDFEKELSGIFKRLRKRQEQIAEEEAKNRRKFAKDIAKKTNDIVNELSDTSEPLTKMTGLAGDFGKALGGLGGGLLKDSKSLGVFGERLKKTLPGLNIAGDALMAYIGFQAGRVEQFAAAQKTMINAGAIYYESAAEFDQLYKNATAAGITYTQLANIASNYGTALQSLGTGVSSGVKQFSDFFKDINTTSDRFGDFGLSSESLATTYAEFIDLQRLTGSINRDTIGVQDKLRQGFQELMLETTALSSLTGKNRNELLQQQMAALKDPRNAAALIKMRESGLVNQASAAEEIIKQFASGTEEFGQVGVSLSNALAEELSTTKENIEDFDITDVLRQTDPVLMNVLQEHAPNFLSGINEAVQTGQLEGNNLSTFIYDEFMKMRESLEDEDIFQGAIGPSNEYAQMVRDLQSVSILTEKTFGNVRSMTDEELAKFQTRTSKNLGEAGQAVVAVNDLITTFLEVQNALTYPLNKSADMAEALSGTLRSALDKLKGMDDDSGPDSIATKAAELAAQQGIAPEDYGGSDPANDVYNMGPDEILPYDAEAIETAIQQGLTQETMFSPSLGKDIIILKDGGDPVVKFEARKDGGGINKGETYLVGEEGPEFIEPGQSGNVTSFSKTTEQIKEREAVLGSMLDNVSTFFENYGGNNTFEKALNGDGDDIPLDSTNIDSIINSADFIDEKINETDEKFEEFLNSADKKFMDELNGGSNIIDNFLLNADSNFEEALRSSGDAIDKLLDGSGDAIDKFLDGGSDSIDEVLTKSDEKFDAALNDTSSIDEVLNSKNDSVDAALNDTSSIDEVLNNKNDSVDAALNDTSSIDEVLNSKNDSFDTVLNDTSSIDDALTKSDEKFDTALNDTSSIDTAMARGDDQFDQLVSGKSNMVAPRQENTTKIKSPMEIETEDAQNNNSPDVETMLSEYSEIKKNQLEVVKRLKTLVKALSKSNTTGTNPLVQ